MTTIIIEVPGNAELVEELRLVEAEHDPAACITHTEVMRNMEKIIAERA